MTKFSSIMLIVGPIRKRTVHRRERRFILASVETRFGEGCRLYRVVAQRLPLCPLRMGYWVDGTCWHDGGWGNPSIDAYFFNRCGLRAAEKAILVKAMQSRHKQIELKGTRRGSAPGRKVRPQMRAIDSTQ